MRRRSSSNGRNQWRGELVEMENENLWGICCVISVGEGEGEHDDQ